MSQTIRFPAGGLPGWDDIRAQLDRLGRAFPLRMIDGLPAFPDETPEPGWKELRVAAADGMVTVRAGGDTLTTTVWGNATDSLQTGWDAVTWACAAAGGGNVEAMSGPLAAADFARTAGLRPA